MDSAFVVESVGGQNCWIRNIGETTTTNTLLLCTAVLLILLLSVLLSMRTQKYRQLISKKPFESSKILNITKLEIYLTFCLIAPRKDFVFWLS